MLNDTGFIKVIQNILNDAIKNKTSCSIVLLEINIVYNLSVKYGLFDLKPIDYIVYKSLCNDLKVV